MEIYATALVICSLMTSLITEAIKKLFSESKITYKPNILAAIVSVVVSILLVIGYVIYMELEVTSQIVVSSIALTILSFLCATVGYDKVIQTINQFK